MSELDNCCGTTCDKQKLAEEITALKAQVEQLCDAVINLEGYRSRHKDSSTDGYCYHYFEVQRVISYAKELRCKAKAGK